MKKYYESSYAMPFGIGAIATASRRPTTKEHIIGMLRTASMGDEAINNVMQMVDDGGSVMVLGRLYIAVDEEGADDDAFEENAYKTAEAMASLAHGYHDDPDFFIAH